jgi:amidophosphoribosyltransferase
MNLSKDVNLDNQDINNQFDNEIINNSEIDKAHANCAVAGIYGHPQAALLTYYMLHSMQHRGQEAAGITSFYLDETQKGSGNKRELKYANYSKKGLVLDVFSNPEIFTNLLKGEMAIGHTRYSAAEAANSLNIQPLNMKYKSGILSISHNGSLVNTNALRKELENKGAIFHTTTDTELFMHLIAHSKKETQIDQIRDALATTNGAFSLAILTENGLVAARDPHGVRPLSIGRIKIDKKIRQNRDNNNCGFDNEYAYVVASETCAFDMIGAEEIRTIKHNEIIEINEKTLKTGEIISYKIQPETPIAKHCIFEYIYFSRPDSRIFGHNVDKARRKFGKNLAEEYSTVPYEGRKVTVISVPDSGNTAALGYARANQKQDIDTAYEIGLIRSHYVGRTFIQAGQDNREFKVKSKFNTVRGVIEDRNIVVVDDSIVRGTTSKALIKLIRNAEPARLHLRITSPPVLYPCHYGMDFPHKKDLIANEYESEEEIAEFLGVESLHYLSMNKLMDAVPNDEGISYCTACFTGDYPIEVEPELEK